jgi:class 3 adenylate cyclase
MTVAGPPVRQPQKVAVTVREDGSLSKVPARLRPGPIELTVRYGYPRFWGFALRSDEPLKNWVSALHVTSQQDFRDLFAGEFLAPDVSFAIRSVTLMFTDIKASTEMYERLGDSRAYAVVQDHFRVMTGVIRAREGAVVKTIGDAVMASFPASRDAAAAAREIQEAFARSSIRGLRVEVKIGLHRGPVIAVTSNRALDFFGRAVNVAARVQGESSAGEVLATDAVLADPEAARRLSGRGARARAFTASLKGVRGGVRLRAFRFARGRARA